MKITDDYEAKSKLWVANPKVVPQPKLPPIPRFAPQKFRTHEEMNRWKEALLRKMARENPGAIRPGDLID